MSKSEPKDKSFQISKGLVWEAYIVRGWMNYYGRFNRAEMYSLLKRVNTYVMRWARKKYVRLRSWKRFKAWVARGHGKRTRALRPLGLDARVPVEKMRRAE